ncbi:hypothetical protein [Inhella sp.]|uniref:hypothetical protein n=1 Tax=Inhella sp. TaxID=1921806 RepID=UPI0035AF41CD
MKALPPLASALLLALLSSLPLHAAASPEGGAALARQHLAAVGDAAPVQTRRVHLRAVGLAPFELPIVVEARRPAQLRREVDIQGQRQITGFDGQRAWRIDPFVPGGAAELPAAELSSLRHEALFDGLLAQALQQGWPIEDLGTRSEDGRPLRLLRTAMPGQAPVTLYLDAKSLLEHKRAQQQDVHGQQLAVETFSTDYRRVGSLQIPHRIEVRVPGLPHPIIMAIERVELNPVLDASRFRRGAP